MRRYRAILGAAVILIVIGFSLGFASIGEDSDGGDRRLATVSSGISEMVDAEILATAAGPADSIYFFPQDTSATITVLFLTNTTNQSVEVSGWAYSPDGSELSSVWYLLSPGQMKTIGSDDFLGFNPSVWNFGSSCAYAKLALPHGVVVDGYVAWSNANPSYDPDVPTYTLPLRFTTVPAQ